MFKGKNSGLKEKAAAWGVTTAMKVKRRLGSGCGFKAAVTRAKKAIKNKKSETDLKKILKTGIAAAKKSLPKKMKNKKHPRIISIPKKGGVIPLIPIFAGLSALGTITGGISNVIKAVKDFQSARKEPVHLGKGLYMTPYKGSSYKLTKTQQKSKN